MDEKPSPPPPSVPAVTLNVSAYLQGSQTAFGSLSISQSINIGDVTFEELGRIFARLNGFAEEMRALVAKPD